MSLQRPPHELVATVLGAGTMGAQIAAHLANAGVRTHLLDIVPKDASGKARSAIAVAAVKALRKAKPDPLMHPSFALRIVPGNLEDQLADAVGSSDIVIEAVVERLDVKRELFTKVWAAAKPSCILATNTSGIEISAIADGLPEAARPRLVGMHFFNPPRYMHLLELVPSSSSDPAIIEELRQFSEDHLGKGVVVARDTPNFVGNRIGIAEMLLSFQAGGDSFTIEEIDFLNGKLMGRPKTGTHRLGDLVGLDVVAHVIGNLANNLSADPGAENHDPLHAQFKVPPAVASLIEAKRLGDKTGAGFYKKSRDEQGKRVILSFDAKAGDYRPQQKPKFEELRDIVKIPELDRRVYEAIRVEGRVGDYLRNLYFRLFNYAAVLCESICESPAEIDDAMCWGFGWQKGPFALWDAVGVKWSVAEMQKLQLAVTPAVQALAERDGKWLDSEAGTPKVYRPSVGEHRLRASHARALSLAAIRATTADIHSNATAGLVDIGEGVACVEFRSKMNILDEGVVRMLAEAPQRAADKGFRALVVSNDADDFSLGANLMQVVGWILQKNFTAIEKAVANFQNALMGLRHGPIPVVIAPFGRTLGGGTEITLHGAAVQAHAELYMGLVEIGVGVLPAGGGLKEICRRAHAWAAQVPDGDPNPWIARGFGASATAKVSSSAYAARDTGWLRETDGITPHRRRLLADARDRAAALALAGWRTPDRNEQIQVIGRSRAAVIKLGAKLFEWGGYATEHDRLIAEKIVHVLAGGQRNGPHSVTAQTLLDLEREAFVSLCGEAKTLARMQHTLQNGKPLRN